eukprot:CFRG4102T1
MTMEWAPPAKIEELYSKSNGGKFSSINAPTAGARNDKPVETGTAPIQLYSLATPNGIKAQIILEELVDCVDLKYDAHTINIGAGAQFDAGFVKINPNSKIPCLTDKDGPDGNPIDLFESGSIVVYLAEKYKKFIPSNPRLRTECMNWAFWQMAGQGPMSGNFGHFMLYAPAEQIEARDYGVARYGMETQRLTDVIEKHLADGEKEYLVGNEYTIADILCFPWFHQLRTSKHEPSGVAAKDFLSTDQYKHTNAWADRILARPAVKRGMEVCGFKKH